MREAEESGLRQVEERIRRTEDELFKQVSAWTRQYNRDVNIIIIRWSMYIMRL